MDCWIASFPRSGNTYFRNILYFVYGVESSTWHKETTYPVDDKYDSYRFVKTHLLPEDLIPADPAVPAIYLVRDGRDAVVSIAHHRKDLVKPGSEFLSNLEEAIIAAEGSFFGGWSGNAAAWIQRANLIIRYEDLIADPKSTFKRVEELIPLPPAKWDNLPGFEEMKAGKARYGATSKKIDAKFKPEDFAGKFFRKGKSGGWKEEMPSQMQDLFWNYHGEMMERLGYHTYSGSVNQNPLLDYRVLKKMGRNVPALGNTKFKIYIEATKLIETANDGIKRYLEHLLKGFEDVLKNGDPRWEFYLIIERKIHLLKNYKETIKEEEIEKTETLHPYEKVLLGFKRLVQQILPEKLYANASRIYKKTNIRKVLRTIQVAVSAKPIRTFHQELLAIKEKVDLFHIPLPQNSHDFKLLNHRYVVTVHDITHKLFPDYHEHINASLAETGMQFIINKNAEVIAVSKNTILDLDKNYPSLKNKPHLVYEAADNDLFRWNTNKGRGEQIRYKYKLGLSPFFLCLSTIEPRKNLPNTIRAFNKLIEENPGTEINLVISGNFGWKTEHLSEELHLDNPRIIFTGYVDDLDLPVIYSEALALCYISFYEGFGLPPLEAMSCRTPVIYGNNSSMIEVIGDAGLAANAHDIHHIKQQMFLLFSDEKLRERLAALSLHRSFEFNRRKSTFETLKVYENVISKNLPV